MSGVRRRPSGARAASQSSSPSASPSSTSSKSSKSSTSSTSSTYSKIYAVVRRVPRGRVTTYGDVAEMADLPGHARQVGYALHALGERDDDVPWQRVVNARGELSPRSEPGMEGLQRRILEAEGVVFDERGRIDLARHRWRPRTSRR